MEQKRKGIKVKDIISTIFIIVLLIIAYNYYKRYNFNDFVKAERTLHISTFERDSSIKASNADSYKIINKSYNDAMFYKRINVQPNTAYKVSCKIKTDSVESLNSNSDSGAHICIADTDEKSDNVTGTTDWTDVTFYFNSKNRTEISIGFRLGGFEDTCVGTAWFSDFKIESGILDNSNKWNFICLVFDYIDVNIGENGIEQNIKLSLTETDKDDISNCMRRFQTSMQELSQNKIKINYDIVEISEPITSISYDKESGYFVSGNDIKDVLNPYIEQGKYDHIFVCFRTGDINVQGSIPVNDWIGLGYMQYRNIGYSNIRLPDDDKNYIYKYDSRINTFPEEVLVHEFLHTLERNAEEYGEERPSLHDNEKYGYYNQELIGLKDWYKDYMNKDISSTAGKIGLPNEVYTWKPVKTSDFEYSHNLNAFKEPENIFEELKGVWNKITNLFSVIGKNKTVQEQ